MTPRTVLPYIEVIAGAFALYFGIKWLLDPQGPHEPGFAFSALVLVLTEAIRRYLPATTIRMSEIDTFIQEGQNLRDRADSDPLPVAEQDEWIVRMNKYFEDCGAPKLRTRLNDFTGLTFYGDGSEVSQYLRSIDGRIRRLMEFASELASHNSQ